METLYRDRQLAAREHFIEVEHPEHGMLVIEGSRSRLSRTPARAPKRAPTYGCDNRKVLEELLGYSPDFRFLFVEQTPLTRIGRDSSTVGRKRLCMM